MTMNPENKCHHLMSDTVPDISIEQMFNMQKVLQQHYASKGKTIDLDNASFKEKVDNITVQYRNMTLEFAELLERLPFKEWKTYSEEEKANFLNEEQRLEVLYEYIDMFHFFLVIGLNLGVDGELFKKLYYTKNKENFSRIERGY